MYLKYVWTWLDCKCSELDIQGKSFSGSEITVILYVHLYVSLEACVDGQITGF